MSPLTRQMYTALTADLVASSSQSAFQRSYTQRRLEAFMRALRQQFQGAFASEAVISGGDGFQVLLSDVTVLIPITWLAEKELGVGALRLVVARGEIHTDLDPNPLHMDGPVFHLARDAMEEQRRSDWRGCIFRGFGDDEDAILSGLAELLQRLRGEMTKRQWLVANTMREAGLTQREAAARLGVSAGVISRHLHSIGWKSYVRGEQAFRVVLRRYAAREAQRVLQ